MGNLKRFVASFLVLCMVGLGLPLPSQAGLISTQEAAAGASGGERERVEGFLARAEVRQALEAHGVRPEAALERVQSMSDAEVTQLAQRIDEAPAGGDVLGVLFTVFVVLLITDILGFTKVFPFTRSVR